MSKAREQMIDKLSESCFLDTVTRNGVGQVADLILTAISKGEIPGVGVCEGCHARKGYQHHLLNCKGYLTPAKGKEQG